LVDLMVLSLAVSLADRWVDGKVVMWAVLRVVQTVEMEMMMVAEKVGKRVEMRVVY